MLELKELHSYYGASHNLHGIDLEVKKGQVITLLGRNGIGKTTTIHSIIGFVGKKQGGIFLEGENITGLKVIKLREKALELFHRGDGFSLTYRLQKI